MKKLQLFIALFFVAATTDIFAGKTVRNSAEEPKAKQQFIQKRANRGPKENKQTKSTVRNSQATVSAIVAGSTVKK